MNIQKTSYFCVLEFESMHHTIKEDFYCFVKND